MAKRTKITVSIAPSTMERLRRFCEEHDGVLFVKPEELAAALGGDDICKTLRCVLY